MLRSEERGVHCASQVAQPLDMRRGERAANVHMLTSKVRPHKAIFTSLSAKAKMP